MAPIKKPPHRRSTHFLREWREHAGLTQEQAAEKVETSRSSLSKIEAALVPYNQDILERLAAAYGCTPADLISRDPADDLAMSLFDLPVGDKERVRNFISALRASNPPEATPTSKASTRRKVG